MKNRFSVPKRLVHIMSIFLVAALLDISGAAHAAVKCNEDERFAPFGRVVELGVRSFRFCGRDVIYVEGTDTVQRIRIPKDSSHVKKILTQFPELDSLWGELQLYDQPFTFPNDRSFATADTYVGDVYLANARYRYYTNNPLSDEGLEQIQRAYIPRGGVLVFDDAPDFPLPPHFLSCSGTLKGSPQEEFDCFIYVSFDKPDTLVAYTRILWFPELAEYRSSGPFDFDNLHIMIEALVALFESIKIAPER
ncbi:hypothetical protein [uncultured Tateyamaria sp.]|uniref:hypothetical protein n=1 Tax=uncultured Tateyamaria sp. TaxID=455651 RepID=UPI002603CD17|nr:hypothetical protein [uncultured Tateyamaria sp.]